MKKISWKSALVGRLVAAACAACLLLFTLSATVAHAALLNFDTIGENAIPQGYGNLMWDNFYVLDAADYANNPSGYLAGMVSAKNVAYNAFADPATISTSDKGFFILNSAFLTGAWNDNLVVTVKGYLFGGLVYTKRYTLSATHPTLIRFPAVPVQRVVFSSSGGTNHGYDDSGEHFAMDNLNVTVIR
jgi:hypothetical protein